MSRVVLDQVTKEFPSANGVCLRALEDLSLAVEDKERLVLVGPSGCGKTTTLRLIAGLDAPTRGTVSIGGSIVNGVPPKDRNVAMVLQSAALYPHMTVRENMAFGLKVRRQPREEIATRVNAAAQMLGLTRCLDRLPAALSGGERQRVAVGRAIVRQPAVFLFDEPLSSLDPPLRAQLRAELSSLHDKLGATTIHVTHDQAEAMALGHRIAVLNAGKLQQIGPGTELYHQPCNLFVAGFFGSPQINLVRGQLTFQNGQAVFEERNADGTRPPNSLILRIRRTISAALAAREGTAVVLGIRPEDIALAPTGSSSPDWEQAEARVHLIESQGPDTFVHLRSGAHELICRTSGEPVVSVGAAAPVRVNMSRAHLFDSAGGLTFNLRQE